MSRTPLESLQSTAMLRLAGLPIRIWLQGANQELFALDRRILCLRQQYAEAGLRLADFIGAKVVPLPRLTSEERTAAIQLRRKLHNGALAAKACTTMSAMLRSLAGELHPLAADLEHAAEQCEQVEELEKTLEALLNAEPARVARSAYESVAQTPVFAALIAERNPELFAEVRDRLRRGESWNGKSLRRSGDFFWKVIDRAATKTTPRDWHTHVAVAAVAINEGVGGSHLRVHPEAATTWAENIHSKRCQLLRQSLGELKPATRVALTPLHFPDGDRLRCWVSDPEQPAKLSEIELRRTPFLAAVVETLSRGTLPLAELEEALSGVPGYESQELRYGVLDHLMRIGVLELSQSPVVIATPWKSLAAHARDTSAQARARKKDEGFLDVYRKAQGALALSLCREMQGAFTAVQRLLRAIEIDQREPRAGVPAASGKQTLLDFLKERTAAAADPPPQDSPRPQHWPQPRRDDSTYARLLRLIRARTAAAQVDLTTDLLDSCCVPDGDIDWPTDCVLRLAREGAGYLAVLGDAFPAGTLDARFLGPLQDFGQNVGHMHSYQRFLERLESLTGTRFVELLIPPLSIGAANAVLRPLYTRYWTGDADLHTYVAASHGQPEYLLLSEIFLTRVEGQLYAEARGMPLCPVYHATRIPMPPWNIVAETLLAAGPLPMRWSPRKLHWSLDAFPDLRYLPRITVCGKLVICGAQWRLSKEELREEVTDLRQRVRWLNQMRARLNLPRWAFVSADRAGEKPMPIDWESIRAIRTLERAVHNAEQEIRIVEMLPAPGDLAVTGDAGATVDRFGSAIVLRMPCEESPEAMGERIAPRFRRSTQLPSAAHCA